MAEDPDQVNTASSAASEAKPDARASIGTSEGSIAPPSSVRGSHTREHSSTREAAEVSNNGDGGVHPIPVQMQGVSGDESGDDEIQTQLKRISIVENMSALTVLTSIVSDLDVFADWYFLNEEGQESDIFDVALAFTVVGTIMYILITVEFHFISMARTWWRKDRPLNPLEHVPLGRQLLINVLVEDIPQLVITWVTSPTSVAGVLNITTAVFALLTKAAEGFERRNELPMSSKLQMVEEDPMVVRHMLAQRRNAEELASKAASLTVLVNEHRRETSSEGQRRTAFRIMQATTDFLNGKLDFVRQKLDVPSLDLDDLGLQGEYI